MPQAPQNLIEQLLQADATTLSETLLQEAAESGEVVVLLFGQAQETLSERPDEAIRIAALTVLVAERREDWRSSSLAWRLQGQGARFLGQQEQAANALHIAGERATQAGDRLLAAQTQIGRIDALGWLSRYDEAFALAERLEQEFQTLGAEADAAKALVNAGNLYLRRDEYDKALEVFGRAVETFQRAGDSVSLARAQANRALILTQLHRIEEALPLYEQARQAFAAAEMRLEAAMIDANVGYLRFVSGAYSVALASYAQARQEFQALGRELETAKIDLDTGDAYRALNLFPEAVVSYDQAESIFAARNIVYECGMCALGKALALANLGGTADVEAELTRADDLFRAQKNQHQRAKIRHFRAFFQHRQGDISGALAEARQASRFFARRKLHGWAAEARFLIAEAALASGEKATRGMRAIARIASQTGRGWLEARAWHRLGLYYLQGYNQSFFTNDRRKGLDCLRRSVAALESARAQIAPEEMHVAYMSDKFEVYEDMVDALLARGGQRDIAEAWEYVGRAKSRLLLERLQEAREGTAPAQSEAQARLQRRVESLRAQLSQGYHALFQLDDQERQRFVGATTNAADLLPLERAYREALRDQELLERETESGGFGVTVPLLPALQAALRSDETLIEFYATHKAICAFVVQQGRVVSRQEVATEEEIGRLARRLRYHLQRTGTAPEPVRQDNLALSGGVQLVCAQLYYHLLRPLESLLTTEKLVIAPHGLLHGLPFHAFFDGAQYALDRWEIVYTPSAAIWETCRRRSVESDTKADGSALLMAVPSPGIERVASEAEALRRLLPEAQAFCAQEATLERFWTLAPQAPLLHLATHAQFRADNPLFSGLRLADGWLLARDLYGMRLRCALATLSACQTGMVAAAPGDELFGLLRGFLTAGARSVAASFWLADDVATAELMTRFYALMLEGVGRGAALRSAQQSLRQTYPHPYYWAAFALVGER